MTVVKPTVAGMLEAFQFTDEDLERGAHALLRAHGNPLNTIPEDEREAAFANAQEDVRAVLEGLGGEWL